MQRERTPEGLSAAARQAVDDYYANHCPELSSRHPEIAERLDVLERCRVATQDLPVRKAAKVVGKGLAAIDEWVARLEEGGPANLAKRSTRPRNMRLRERRTPELVALITELRNERFAWGRDKIYHRLRDMGWEVSLTTIGRVIGEILREGEIEPIEAAKREVEQDEADMKKLEQKRRKPKREHAVREKPEPAEVAGDRFRADTPEVHLVADAKVYVMNAVDMVMRQVRGAQPQARHHPARPPARITEAQRPRRILRRRHRQGVPRLLDP